MNKWINLILLLMLGIAAKAQDETPQQPSKASYAYREFKNYRSVPSYSLAKVKQLLKTIKDEERDDMDGYISALAPKYYNALKLREKFTYHLINPESYSQICDMPPVIMDEERKILGRLTDIYDEANWSDRQWKFFKEHRDSVLFYIKDCSKTYNRVGLNFKRIIEQVNGWELIPYLKEVYLKSKKKDTDILTLFMILMRDNKYPPFLESASWKKLYAVEDQYTSYIDFNTANADLILARVTDFYNTKSGK